eukprot:scaffold374_cov124-Cylindrotheca_fusiformis.AAC.13
MGMIVDGEGRARVGSYSHPKIMQQAIGVPRLVGQVVLSNRQPLIRYASPRRCWNNGGSLCSTLRVCPSVNKLRYSTKNHAGDGQTVRLS